MSLDEAAWFSMGSLLGQGTDHQPKAISGDGQLSQGLYSVDDIFAAIIKQRYVFKLTKLEDVVR